MPEYPEITVYVERLRHFVQDQTLEHVRIRHIFLLRTADPPVAALEGQVVRDLERIGKRIVFVFDNPPLDGHDPANTLFLVLHLMITGRLHWQKAGARVPAKRGLGALDFPNGTLLITEASSQKRASLHLVRGRQALRQFDRGGVDVMEVPPQTFRTALRAENHTLKRALTDQRFVSGIGNAYSDEILHRARLSPFLLTQSLTDAQLDQLYEAARAILAEWTDRLRREAGDGFPEKLTAFHPEMAVHGKYDQPCPVCGTPVQRIQYATNETNYCPTCQTEGRLLADRGLSRLLKDDWPRTLEELEERRK